ncbi:DUF4367 domain-containing protein [bacterium LRH843]|nr:DUF4367 domain-containing protein [bacterium LRH843]
MKKLLLSFGFTSLLVFSTACSVEDTEKIIENAVKAQENIESYYAEVKSSFQIEGESESSSYKEWNAKPNKHRLEMDDGYVYVSNGEKSWSYDKNENIVTTFDEPSDMSEEMPSESEMIREMLTEMMNSNHVIVGGKETIANRTTIHLSLEPKEGQEDEFLIGSNYDIWIDAETYMPLKMKWDSEDFLSETEYTHIDYNIDIDENIFTFDIPESATVQTMEDLMPKSISLEELQRVATFTVPEFTYLPEGYNFQEAYYFEEMSMATVEYRDAMDNFLIVSFSEDKSSFLTEEEAEKIQIGRFNGTYQSMFDMQFLSWNTDEIQIELTSLTEELSKEELFKVAEGIQ